MFVGCGRGRHGDFVIRFDLSAERYFDVAHLVEAENGQTNFIARFLSVEIALQNRLCRAVAVDGGDLVICLLTLLVSAPVVRHARYIKTLARVRLV